MEFLFSQIANPEICSNIALVSENHKYSYEELNNAIQKQKKDFIKKNIVNKVIVFNGDFDFDSIVNFLALIQLDNIVLLLSDISMPTKAILKLIGADYYLKPNEGIQKNFKENPKCEMVVNLLNQKNSGLILLSSGTTGKPKAILHSVDKLLKKYHYSKKPFRTIAFLLFDHIAGLDTMFYTFASGGCLVNTKSKEVDEVISTLKMNKVEVFPTSPSYLNMMFLNESFIPENLPNLKIITFGSERITETTLRRLERKFGDSVRILQKYGLTEMGSPYVINKPNDPSWIKIDTRSTKYKIENEILFLKSDSSMLGYIFEDYCELFNGWFNTQDKVEVDGEWIKILGRTTDIINVGGQKVYPAEVESVLLEMTNVKEVSVFAKDNPIMGKIVGARFNLFKDEKLSELKKRVRKYCKDKLESYKIPVHLEITKDNQVSDRFKKVR